MKNGPVYKYKVGEEPPKDTPVQYLKGWTEFYKLKFKVTPDVLIPRPETELLVDEIILRAKREDSPETMTILDIGTGSGCIAISIAKNLPKVKIFATDISEAALDVARENARKHRVDNKIFFLKSDLLDSIVPSGLQNDNLIMVTNLPYIPTSRIPYLDPSVKDFEPKIALDGGHDGFNLYRKLFQEMKDKNIIPKLLVGEIDHTHGTIAINEAKKFFPEAKAEVKTDLTHNIRILIVTF